MLQGEHSAILSTFIKLPFVIKIFVLSIFEWLFYYNLSNDVYHCKSFIDILTIRDKVEILHITEMTKKVIFSVIL